MAHNEVFQFSIISALMDGVASHGIPLSRVLERGNHGLGTFRNMVGEMIIVDGETYQMHHDGTVARVAAPETTITPFATVTRFQATTRARAAFAGMQGLSELLAQLLPATRNHFLAIRMHGVFRTIFFRTAGGQTYPREGMVSVCGRQREHTFEGVRGTVIGFRCPEYTMGINVAGIHIHFITDDRQRGGHILSLETEGEVDVQIAVLSKFHLELPTDSDEFNSAGLEKDAEGIIAAESSWRRWDDDSG